MTSQKTCLISVLEELDDSLRDESLPATQDIAACGVTVLQLLTICSRDLRDRQQPNHRPSLNPSTKAPDVPVILETLVTLAKETIDCVPFNVVSSRWLRLYTDASLLWSIYDGLYGREEEQEEGKEETGKQRRRFWKAVIKRLDMAIIIAGAIGERRMAWIQKVIKSISRDRLSTDDLSSGQEARPAKRARTTYRPRPTPGSEEPKLLFAPCQIPVLPKPPSLSQYLDDDELLQRPFILTRYLDDSKPTSLAWPALEKWSSAAYLLKSVGEGRVVPVEVGGSYNDAGWGQKIIPFRRFLRRAGFKDIGDDDYGDEDEDEDHDLDKSVDGTDSQVEDGNGKTRDGNDLFDKGTTTSLSHLIDQPLYLAQHSLFEQFPELAKDISYPDYVWSNPPAPTTMPSYSSPNTDTGVIVNVWVGSGSGEIVSPAHTDPYYNCYAQVLGQKRVWLAPPECAPYMASYGKPTESTIEDHSTVADMYMTNTSQIPLLRPIDDFQQHQDKFPDFFKHVWPVSMEAVLNPGDLLVMPPGWWHAMRGEGDGPGWSVSMWY